jgi:hypothetical protein
VPASPARGREREEGGGWGPDPPCRRKEAQYWREAARGLSDERNGHGYRQDLRGCGSDPAEGMSRRRPGTKRRSSQERTIQAKLAYALTGKFEQVSYSGTRADSRQHFLHPGEASCRSHGA